MKLGVLFIAAAVAIGSLSACGGSNTVTPGPTTLPPGGGPEPTQITGTPTPTPQVKASGAFGDTITFPSGVAVKASPGRAVPADQYAYGAIEGKIVVFELSVTNGGPGPIEASIMGYPKVSYGAQGIEAQTASDPGGRTGGSFSTILPGETQTVRVSYGIPSASFGDVRMEVRSVNYEDSPAIFKGSVQPE